MEIALKEARLAAERGEVPVGAAVISPQGAVLARAGNQMRAQNDPSAHAEVLAIRSACKALGSERLSGCDLYVSLEPCPMCAGLIAAARIERLYYGACDPKSGGVAQGPQVFSHAQCHHKPEVYSGIAEGEGRGAVARFFCQAARRRALSRAQSSAAAPAGARMLVLPHIRKNFPASLTFFPSALEKATPIPG